VRPLNIARVLALAQDDHIRRSKKCEESFECLDNGRGVRHSVQVREPRTLLPSRFCTPLKEPGRLGKDEAVNEWGE